jgi:hypothetical protein
LASVVGVGVGAPLIKSLRRSSKELRPPTKIWTATTALVAAANADELIP